MSNIQKRINDSLYSNSSCKIDDKLKKNICQNDVLTDDEYWYDCRFCERDFRSEHGRSIHEGRVHKKENDRFKKQHLSTKPSEERNKTTEERNKTTRQEDANLIEFHNQLVNDVDKSSVSGSNASQAIPSLESSIHTNRVSSYKPSLGILNTEEHHSLITPDSNSTVNFEPSHLQTVTPDTSDDEDLINFENLNKTFKYKPVSYKYKPSKENRSSLNNIENDYNSGRREIRDRMKQLDKNESDNIQFEYNKNFLDLKSLEIISREKDNVIFKLKKNIEAKKSDILEMKRSNIGREETIASQNRELSALRKQSEESDRYISNLRKQLNDQIVNNQSNAENANIVESQNRELSALRKKSEESDRYISNLRKQLNEQSEALSEKNQRINSMNDTLTKTKDTLKKSQDVVIDLENELVIKERNDMDVDYQNECGSQFTISKNNELSVSPSKIDVNDFMRNLDGTADARDKNFRKCLQFAHQKPYPVNKDGSPDMRCTKNPHILKMKLDLMMKK